MLPWMIRRRSGCCTGDPIVYGTAELGSDRRPARPGLGAFLVSVRFPGRCMSCSRFAAVGVGGPVPGRSRAAACSVCIIHSPQGQGSAALQPHKRCNHRSVIG